MNKKKKHLKIKNVAILFIFCLIGVGIFLLNSQEGETKDQTSTAKIVSKKDDSGVCTYVLMETGDVNQIKIGAYQGCETVSLYNALVYLNKTQGKTPQELIDDLPLVSWGANPNTRYAGDPWTSNDDIPDGGFPTIWPDAFMKFAQSNGVQVVNLSGESISEIENIVLKEHHIVEMWVTVNFDEPQITYTDYYGYKVVANTHAVLLDGYDADEKEFHVNDPIKGKYWLSQETVNSIYTGTNQFAVEFVS